MSEAESTQRSGVPDVPTASTLRWPPSDADLEAIARVDTTQAVASVRPDPGRSAAPYVPADSLAVRNSFRLEWPPSADDLARVMVVPLAGLESGSFDIQLAQPGAHVPSRWRMLGGRRPGWHLAPFGVAAATVLSLYIAGGGSGPATEIATPPQAAAVPSGGRAAAPARPGPVVRTLPPVVATGGSVPAPPAARAAALNAAPVGASIQSSPSPQMSPAASSRPTVVQPTAVAAAEVRRSSEAGESTLAAPPPTSPSPASPAIPELVPPVLTTVANGTVSGAVPVPVAPALPERVSPAPARVERPAELAATPRAAGTARASDEPAIRALLERYGNAYTRLDARAARAVWPGVDARALSRAFEALESQAVVFDACDVTVTGRAAQAACRGTATWVPRVGERRPHRESREWTFRLEKSADADWQIRSAAMR